MKIERHDDAASFLARAEAYLGADDAINGMVHGVARRLVEGQRFGDGTPWFVTAEEASNVVFALVRTPPYNVAISDGPTVVAAAVGRALALGDDVLPGVAGPRAAAFAFAEAVVEQRGHVARERFAQELYTLREVAHPRPGPGEARGATAADRPLLLTWFRAFDDEAVGDGTDPAAVVDRHLTAGSAYLYLDDEPVSMLVANRTTERGVRIGGVYTPRALRGRGYASRLVADVSQRMLDDGAEYVSLFTDLKNPTSNGIYRALGYAPAGKFTIIDFVDGA